MNLGLAGMYTFNITNTMINFFRKFRKQLADDNQFFKYSRYAIGEIVLVVIGILIALQLNNLNEQSKNKGLEKKYLVKLHNEFELNRQICLRDIQFHETQIKSARLVLNVSMTDTIIQDLNKLHLATMHTGYGWHGGYIDDVWSELINTGNQILISNDIVRENITRFQREANRIISNESEWEQYNLKYRDITADVLPPNLRVEVGLITGYANIDGILNHKLLNLDELRENLRKIDGLNGIVTDIIIVREVGLSLINKNLERVNLLIEQLNQELESFKN
jgi:hypothetical protein